MNKIILCCLLLFIVFGCRYESLQGKQDIVVCITFDDNCKSVYTEALPIMNQFGYRGTTFVNTGRIGYSAYCSWNQLNELKHIYDWEIGGHTLSHKQLASLSAADAEKQISADFNNLNQHGLNPESFASPFGECPAEYYPLITKYYKNIRTTMNSSMRIPIDRTLLGAYWVGYSATPESLIDRIKGGIADKENLVIFFFHDIETESSMYENSHYSPESFREFLTQLHALGVKVLPLNEALDYLED